MAVLPLRLWPDPVLSRVADPAGPLDDALRGFCADMLDTMYDAAGRGLAAPQLGLSRRIFVMDATWKEGRPAPRVFLDPVILTRSDDTATGPEGCLSIPGITCDIARARTVRLRFRGLDDVDVEEELTGFAAICAQHEIDHLDGLVTFDRLSPAARLRAERAYAAATAAAQP